MLRLYIDNYASDMSLLTCEASGIQGKKALIYKVAYMGVEEQRVNTPRERLWTPVHVVIPRRLRELSAVLLLDVRDVCSMLSFSIIHPGNADSD